MLGALHRVRSQLLDWRYEGTEAVVFNGLERLRLRPEDGKLFSVELERGSGWRRVPGSKPVTLKQQLRLLEQRCL